MSDYDANDPQGLLGDETRQHDQATCWSGNQCNIVISLRDSLNAALYSLDAAGTRVMRPWNSLAQDTKKFILATTGLTAVVLALQYGPGVPKDTKVVVTQPTGYRLTSVDASWQATWPTQEVSQPGENERTEMSMPRGSDIKMTATDPNGASIDFSVRVDNGKWSLSSWLYNPEFEVIPDDQQVQIKIHSVWPWEDQISRDTCGYQGPSDLAEGDLLPANDWDSVEYSCRLKRPSA